MKTQGKLTGIQVPFRSKKPIISLEVSADPEQIEKYLGIEQLDIEIKKHRKRRSLDANACLWACLSDIASALRSDNWTVYLYMLEKYGKCTHLLIRQEAVDAMRSQWRETKVVGETDVNGETMVSMLCYFGSSTYNTKEFSRLLDGVISEMKEMKLETPPDEEMRAILADMERRENDQADKQKETRCGGT